MFRRILCINSGSSSLKFSIYEMGDEVGAGARGGDGVGPGMRASDGEASATRGSGEPSTGGGSGDLERLVATGAVEGIGQPAGRFWVRDGDGNGAVDRRLEASDHAVAVAAVLQGIPSARAYGLDGVGHRFVHGGPDQFDPVLLAPQVLAALRGVIPLAPLHLPSEIQTVEAFAAQFPGVPQVACFDTRFHRHIPEVAARLPLPRGLWDEGVRRYGFHGLSYEYVLDTLGTAPGARVVIAHLGNGSSMVAIRDGRAVDTTMGLTPMGGFMMGTRPGDLDPGVLLYLNTHKGLGPAALERMLDKESGMAGVSGSTGDVKRLLALRPTDRRAAQALEMYCYQARKTIGALTAVLGGLDTLVFTGGIGERAAPVRAAICGDLGYLGIRLDAVANDRDAALISGAESRVEVHVTPTNEALMIARHTLGVLHDEWRRTGGVAQVRANKGVD